MRQTGYSTASVGPALVVLRALIPYVSHLIEAAGDPVSREIGLIDTPGAEPRNSRLADVIRDEVNHAADHLREIAETRRQSGLRA
jgi:hypothetical protein